MNPFYQPIKRFWQQVVQHCEEIRMLGLQQTPLSDHLIEIIQDYLLDIDPYLTFHCGRDEGSDDVDLVFGCDGYTDRIDLVLDVVNAAPQLQGLRPVAFNARVEQIPELIDMGEFWVALDDPFFQLRQLEQTLHLDIYLEDLQSFDADPRQEAVMLLLDAILGEYELMTRIASINWLDLPADPLDHGLLSLSHLRTAFDGQRHHIRTIGIAVH
jgi:hypothetical protein